MFTFVYFSGVIGGNKNGGIYSRRVTVLSPLWSADGGAGNKAAG